MTNEVDETIEVTACRISGEDYTMISIVVPSVVNPSRRYGASMTINQQELLNLIEELKGLVK